jgi:hypothetical protein
VGREGGDERRMLEMSVSSMMYFIRIRVATLALGFYQFALREED